jgi:hypothetical protein
MLFNGYQRTGTVLTALSLLTFAANSAMAQGLDEQDPSTNIDFIHELKVGFLKHDVDNLWSSFSREDGWDLNVEIIFTPSTTILGGVLRPALGGSLNSSGDTNKIYLDGRWEYAFDNGIYAGLGLGVALHDGEKKLVNNNSKALGSAVLFHIPLEVGYNLDNHNNVSLYFDHMSNGYTQTENEGMDSLGLRYGYRF